MPEEYWDTPEFLRVNYLISWVWADRLHHRGGLRLVRRRRAREQQQHLDGVDHPDVPDDRGRPVHDLVPEPPRRRARGPGRDGADRQGLPRHRDAVDHRHRHPGAVDRRRARVAGHRLHRPRHRPHQGAQHHAPVRGRGRGPGRRHRHPPPTETVARPVPIPPGPGQESVWDYPRPPRVEPTSDRIVVELGGVVVADTVAALRVLETSQPPAYYLPPADIDLSLLRRSAARPTTCEWKGVATYLDVVVGEVVVAAAGWTYPEPWAGYEAIAGHVAFYAQKMDRCSVAGEVVQPNEGDFYGGWVTSKVVGPFKGGPGSWGW